MVISSIHFFRSSVRWRVALEDEIVAGVGATVVELQRSDRPSKETIKEAGCNANEDASESQVEHVDSAHGEVVQAFSR